MDAICLGCGEARGDDGDALFCPACAVRLARRAPPLDAPCFLCGEDLDDRGALQLRGFAICRACAIELARDDDTDADDDAPVAHTPGSGTVACSCCGRSMPGPGSYRVVGGRPRCPACAPLMPMELSDVRPAEVSCAACLRALPRADTRLVRGHRLCPACLDSDPALALAVARARHRRALERLGRRLLDDGDE